MDIHFIQFYIKKRYSQSIEEYFNVTSAVASYWRTKKMPVNRINEFMVRENSLNIYELFETIYPKIEK